MSSSSSSYATPISATNAKYCYIDFDINSHRDQLSIVTSFVYYNHIKYSLSSNQYNRLGGSEISRLIDDQLIENDHDYSTLFHQYNMNSIKSIRPPLSYGIRIMFELDWNDCPITCENFATLCSNGTILPPLSSSDTDNTNNKNRKVRMQPLPIGSCGKPMAYKNSIIHRIIPNYIMQGGDYIFGNGTGGESIYNNGKKFKDERAGLIKKHNQRGILSMGNSGKNSNSSQFFITLNTAQQCDGKHVIFGHMISGYEILKVIQEIHDSDSTSTNHDNSEQPKQSIVITDCGLWKPFIIPGNGYWYDPPPSDTTTMNPIENKICTSNNNSSIFIVKPRIIIISPNQSVHDKYKEIISTHCIIVDMILYEHGDDEEIQKIHEQINKYLLSYTIDIVLIAPTCRTIINSSYQLPISFINDAIQAGLINSEDNNNFISQVLLISKPLESLRMIHTQSWLKSAKYHINGGLWKLDCS